MDLPARGSWPQIFLIDFRRETKQLMGSHRLRFSGTSPSISLIIFRSETSEFCFPIRPRRAEHFLVHTDRAFLILKPTSTGKSLATPAKGD